MSDVGGSKRATQLTKKCLQVQEDRPEYVEYCPEAFDQD